MEEPGNYISQVIKVNISNDVLDIVYSQMQCD
jgi:hypothetical protein